MSVFDDYGVPAPEEDKGIIDTVKDAAKSLFSSPKVEPVAESSKTTLFDDYGVPAPEQAAPYQQEVTPTQEQPVPVDYSVLAPKTDHELPQEVVQQQPADQEQPKPSVFDDYGVPDPYSKDEIVKSNIQNKSNFRRGLESGSQNLQAMLFGAMGIAGAATDIDKVRDVGFEGYQRNIEEASFNPTDVQRFTDIDWGSLDSVTDYISGTAGQLVPSVAESIVTAAIGGVIGGASTAGAGAVPGAVGGFAAKTVVRKLLKKKVADLMEKEVYKKIAKDQGLDVARKAAFKSVGKKIGVGVGIVAGVGAMEAGGMWGEDAETNSVEKANWLSALVLGTVSGGSELFAPGGKFARGIVGDGAVTFMENIFSSAGKHFWKRLGIEIPKAMSGEAGQEAFQGFLGKLNEKINDTTGEVSLTDKDAILDYVNDAAAGAVGGLGFGAFGGAMSPGPVKPKGPIGKAVEPVVEPVTAAEPKGTVSKIADESIQSEPSLAEPTDEQLYPPQDAVDKIEGTASKVAGKVDEDLMADFAEQAVDAQAQDEPRVGTNERRKGFEKIKADKERGITPEVSIVANEVVGKITLLSQRQLESQMDQLDSRFEAKPEMKAVEKEIRDAFNARYKELTGGEEYVPRVNQELTQRAEDIKAHKAKPAVAREAKDIIANIGKLTREQLNDSADTLDDSFKERPEMQAFEEKIRGAIQSRFDELDKSEIASTGDLKQTRPAVSLFDEPGFKDEPKAGVDKTIEYAGTGKAIVPKPKESAGDFILRQVAAGITPATIEGESASDYLLRHSATGTATPIIPEGSISTLFTTSVNDVNKETGSNLRYDGKQTIDDESFHLITDVDKKSPAYGATFSVESPEEIKKTHARKIKEFTPESVAKQTGPATTEADVSKVKIEGKGEPKNESQKTSKAETGKKETGREQWEKGIRFFRSGTDRSAELPSGGKVILKKGSTPKNFLTRNKEFLDSIWERTKTETKSEDVAEDYITPEEALRTKKITKKQYETMKYGGLSKKQSDRMNDLADKHNEEYRKVVQDLVDGKNVPIEKVNEFKGLLDEKTGKPKTPKELQGFPWRAVPTSKPSPSDSSKEVKGEISPLEKIKESVRGVSLAEFNAAVVPKDTDAELVQALKDRGLTVKFYKPGDNESRLKAVRSSATLFSKSSESLPASERANVREELISTHGKRTIVGLERKGLLKIVTPTEAAEILGVQSSKKVGTGPVSFQIVPNRGIRESGKVTNSRQATGKHDEPFGDRDVGADRSGSINASPDKTLSNNTHVNIKMLSDLSESKSFLSHGFSGLDIPTQTKVIRLVSDIIGNEQVRDFVVKFIPVNVVDVFSSEQLSAKMLLHDQSVSKYRPSSIKLPNVKVSIRKDGASAAITALARFATKVSLADPRFGFGENIIAEIATQGSATSPASSGAKDSIANKRWPSEDSFSATVTSNRNFSDGAFSNLSHILSPYSLDYYLHNTASIGRVQGFTIEKTTYLVDGNIIKGTAKNILLHELGGHVIISGAFTGKKWDAIVSTFKRLESSDTETGKAIRAARKRIPADTKAENINEELISYYLEGANSKQTLFRKILAFIKESLVSLGFDAKMFTPEDLAVIAQAGIKRMAKGAVPSEVADTGGLQGVLASMAKQLGVSKEVLEKEFNETKAKYEGKIGISFVKNWIDDLVQRLKTIKNYQSDDFFKEALVVRKAAAQAMAKFAMAGPKKIKGAKPDFAFSAMAKQLGVTVEQLQKEFGETKAKYEGASGISIDEIDNLAKEDIVTAIQERWFHVKEAYEKIIGDNPTDQDIKDELFGLATPLIVPAPIKIKISDVEKNRAVSGKVVDKYMKMYQANKQAPPILIRKSDSESKDKYVLVEGGHRFYAADKAGLTEIEAIDVTGIYDLDWEAYFSGDDVVTGAVFDKKTSQIGIAPNGKKSNLNDHLWVMVRTPRFKEWFKGSKIVDENGEPLLVSNISSVEGVPDSGSANSTNVTNKSKGPPSTLQLNSLIYIPAEFSESYGGVDSNRMEPSPDSRVSASGQHGYFANAIPPVPERSDSIGRDGLVKFVNPEVFGRGEDGKVLDSIIRPVPVFVMDVFSGKELSSDRLFDDNPMLRDLLSIDGNNPVSISGASGSLNFIATIPRTKEPSVSDELARPNSKDFSTVGTGDNRLHYDPPVNGSPFTLVSVAKDVNKILTGEFGETDNISFSVAGVDYESDIGEAAGIVNEIANKKNDLYPLEAAISAPDFTMHKDPASNRAFEASGKRKENKVKLESFILDHITKDDSPESFQAKNQEFTKWFKELQKEATDQYDEANQYLTETDRTGKAFTVKHLEGYDVKTPDGKVIGLVKTKLEGYGVIDAHHKTSGASGLKKDYTLDPVDGWAVIDKKGKEVDRLDSSADANATMVSSESSALAADGFSPQAIEAVARFRLMTNRAFDLMIMDYQRIVDDAKLKGLDEPNVEVVNEEKRYAIMAPGKKEPIAFYSDKGEAELFIKETGKTIAAARQYTVKRQDDGDIRKNITLTDAMAMMGDLRGSYFPRQRQSGGVVLKAIAPDGSKLREHFDLYLTKRRKYDPVTGEEFSPGKLKELLRQSFNRFTPLGRRIKKLEREGYSIQVERNTMMPESVFEAAQLMTSINAMMEAGMKRSEEQSHAVQQAYAEMNKMLSHSIAGIFKARGGMSSRSKRAADYWEGFETDMLTAGVQYAKGLAGTMAKRKASQDMMEAITGRDIPWHKFLEENPGAKWEDYQEFVKNRMLDPQEQPRLFKESMSWMKEVLRNDEQMDRIIGTMKGLAVVKFLGFRVSSATVNMTNLFQAVPATISSITGGSLRSAIAEVTRSLKLLHDYNKGNSTEEDKQIFTEIRANGWDNPQFNHENAAVLRSKVGNAWTKFVDASMWMFGKAESINRAATIHAAYKQVKKNLPQMNHDETMEMALHISNRSHGIYGKETAPVWTRGEGNILRSGYTFKKFSHNYLLNMGEMVGRDDYKNTAYMLLAPAVLAGGSATLATPIIAGIVSALGGGDDPEEDFYNWAAKTFGTDIPFRHGIPGLAGINLAGSLQMNMPFPVNAKEVVGAPGSIVSDIIEGVQHARKGEVAKSFEKLLPAGFGNISKAVREYNEGVTTGSYGPVYYGDEPIKGTTFDAFIRAFSFNPSRISKMREQQWSEKKIAAKYGDEASEIRSRVKRMLVQYDGIDDNTWGAILADIRRHNEIVIALDRPGISPINPEKTLKRMARTVFVAPKNERMR